MRAPALRIGLEESIADNFAGGGGASLGIEWGLGRSPDIAINHDAQAIAMHAANHPETRHYQEDIWKVDPREACRGRRPALAWFSPDCKHFSKAKGGKPVDKKIRGLAWVVIRWAKAVRPRVIALENVEEFEDWGPLLDNGMPCPERVGLTFKVWRGKLQALGYKVEHRELVAGPYGAATSRKRLYLIARCDGQPIVWPEPTEEFRFDRLDGRSVAADCIDWSLPTYSIFLTKEEARPYKIVRPLAENTMRRIARGLHKFVIDNPEPFIVPYYGLKANETRAHSLREPLKTQTGDPTFSLIHPYLAGVGGRKGQSPETDLQRPLHTVTAKGDTALLAPYVARIGQTGGNGSYSRPATAPVSTITSKAEHLVVAPYMVPRYGEDPNPKRGGGAGQAPRALPVDRPMPTIVPTQNGAQLVAAFLAKHNAGHEATGQHFSDALHTVTSRDQKALVASSLVKLKGTAQHGQQLDLPLHTVQAGGNHYGEVRAFLSKFYGTRATGLELDSPLHTVRSKDCIALVTVHGEPYVIADIGMRMLAPRELYRAQGFPDSYIIDPEVDGRRLPKDAQVRCVGNSVCPPIAAALARAQFEDQVIEVAA